LRDRVAGMGTGVGVCAEFANAGMPVADCVAVSTDAFGDYTVLEDAGERCCCRFSSVMESVQVWAPRAARICTDCSMICCRTAGSDHCPAERINCSSMASLARGGC
jgi:hypothetical protein